MLLLRIFIWVRTLLSSRYMAFLLVKTILQIPCFFHPTWDNLFEKQFGIDWLQLSRDRSAVHVLLTSAGWVHSNVYGLYLIHCIRYLTAVEPFLSTSSAKQTYHHLTSGSVEIPLATWTGNSSSIGKEPVPNSITTRRSATISYISSAEQAIITFTNVLQSNDTVVLVDCTIEWEPDITCTREERNTA